MPYFVYTGVDLGANMKRGSLVARSVQELDGILFARGIALLNAKKKVCILSLPPAAYEKIDFFRHLNVLIRSGILLPNALELIAGQTRQVHFAEIVYALADTVQHGGAIHEKMKSGRFFSPLMVQMVQVGYESGNICAALDVLTLHLDKMYDFRKKLRSAALMPVVTFGFFMLMSCALIVCIVPQLAGLFGSMGQKVPFITQLLIALSQYLVSWYAMLIILGFTGIAAGVYFGLKYSKIRPHCDAFLLRIPFVSQLIIHSTLASFLHALALLLAGGMQLVPALAIVQESIGNTVMREKMCAITKDVESGYSFADALVLQESFVWPPEIIALVRVGQESGSLSDLLERGALIYQEKVERSLSFLATFFQPMLLIILGLLITGLIFVIYTPIINLSYGVF